MDGWCIPLIFMCVLCAKVRSYIFPWRIEKEKRVFFGRAAEHSKKKWWYIGLPTPSDIRVPSDISILSCCLPFPKIRYTWIVTKNVCTHKYENGNNLPPFPKTFLPPWFTDPRGVYYLSRHSCMCVFFQCPVYLTTTEGVNSHFISFYFFIHSLFPFSTLSSSEKRREQNERSFLNACRCNLFPLYWFFSTMSWLLAVVL